MICQNPWTCGFDEKRIERSISSKIPNFKEFHLDFSKSGIHKEFTRHLVIYSIFSQLIHELDLGWESTLSAHKSP